MPVLIEDVALDGNDHVVQFYERESELAETVGSFLRAATRAGGTAIVIATEPHRRAFEAELEAAGVDRAEGPSNGRLILLDAAATMARFMPDGCMDRLAFREVVGSVVRKAGETGGPVRAYGEMVALLWEAGDVLSAIELEKMWNELAGELHFTLLCAYRSESVNATDHAGALQQVCRLHSSVLHPADDLGAASSAGTEVWADFPARHEAARDARHFVSEALARTKVGATLLDDARLVVTELAANAVVHARSSFSVRVRIDESGVRLWVRDSSRARPMLRHTGPLSTSGRGLHLVDALSVEWGVEVMTHGKTVWADLRA
jgi:anti-sigma regulatory factor (Ser/Thr protein kinase)